jgi:hypothetical protein
MKKRISLVILALAGAAAVFGADFSLSAGAGGLLGGVFTRYMLKADGMVDGNPVKIDAGQEMNQLNYGFFAFFDATYGEFSVFFQNGSNTFKEPVVIAEVGSVNSSGKGWETVLGLSLLGKYPFNLNKMFTVFPLLGVNYQISLDQLRTTAAGVVYDRTNGLHEKDKDGNAYKLSDWNSFWIDVGGGVDFALPAGFFLRGELLYGFRLMTPYEIKNLDYMKSMTGDPNPKLSGLTSGPSIRLCAGYRFYTKISS